MMGVHIDQRGPTPHSSSRPRIRATMPSPLPEHSPQRPQAWLRRPDVVALLSILVAVNVGVWLAAIGLFRHVPLLLGTALLAYVFGLRHAVDADHIAAIDNVTRKLIVAGRRSLFVGFFFALGHSTIVVALSVLIAA